MSENSEHVKRHIETAIGRARDGVSEHIDEIDRRLRDTLDLGGQAREYAPQLMIGGAVVGLVVGLTAGRALVRMLAVGVPLAVAAVALRQRMASADVDPSIEAVIEDLEA